MCIDKIILPSNDLPGDFGAFDQDEDDPKEFILLAYHKYLLRCSGGEVDVLAQMILDETMEQSDAAFELLRHITNDLPTEDTFIQAAELLINSDI